MQISYDREADALSIWFKEVVPAKTIDIASDIFIDVDKTGRLAGIEILHAREKTNLLDFWNISFLLPNQKKVELRLPEMVET